jgi:hypothetical protein
LLPTVMPPRASSELTSALKERMSELIERELFSLARVVRGSTISPPRQWNPPAKGGPATFLMLKWNSAPLINGQRTPKTLLISFSPFPSRVA